jgi:hypothetical protein
VESGKVFLSFFPIEPSSLNSCQLSSHFLVVVSSAELAQSAGRDNKPRSATLRVCSPLEEFSFPQLNRLVCLIKKDSGAAPAA